MIYLIRKYRFEYRSYSDESGKKPRVESSKKSNHSIQRSDLYTIITCRPGFQISKHIIASIEFYVRLDVVPGVAMFNEKTS